MEIVSTRLPQELGSYLLILTLPGRKEIAVGRLGSIRLERGWYAYAGSAFGPGGLAARVGRHLRPQGKKHWHIDYLRAEATAVEVWMALGAPNREHLWASLLMQDPVAGQGVAGFGCSDCRCPSHLMRFDRRPGRNLLKKKLGADVIYLRLPVIPACS